MTNQATVGTRKHPPGRRAAQKGFSLLEATLAVVITGILSSVLLPFVRSSAPESQDKQVQGELDKIHHAVLGYALNRYALPAGQGWIDPATLGLPDTKMAVWYAADSRLASAGAGPYTPDPNQHIPQFIGSTGQPSTWPTYSAPSPLNLCAALSAAAQSPQLRVAGVPVAFVMQISPDRNTPPPDFSVLPGSPQAQAQVARGIGMRSVGLGELAARLRCPGLIVRAGSTAQKIVSGQDMVQVAQSLVHFRELQLKRAQQSLFSDDFQIAIRAGLLANLATDLASSVEHTWVSIPDAIDGTNPMAVIALINAIARNAVLIGYIGLQFQILSTLDPGMSKAHSDMASIQSAQAAIGSAQDYVTQLQQMQQSTQSRFRELLSGTL
ncbi:type II secretion system protein [Burkholderia territorii]|uniref:type II secretion system protein n=1 Tax=Burkholderia territorii TaxID=1503055 RepID=UPI0012D904A4|nr:prepilin-type N-terminal cleavage/methylation domain-containing protein [Burkholderia territorii]